MNNDLQNREQQLRNGFIAQQKIVKSLLGDKAKSDKFLATAIKISNDYKLAKCNVSSIIDACINVAQMGLDLSPVLQHAYLVPYGKSVQLIVSDRGYIALLARTGWSLKSFVVRESDEFFYSINGFDEEIRLTPTPDNYNSPLLATYAVAKSPNNELFYQVMYKQEIEKHRKSSATQKNDAPTGVWKEWESDMWKKTVVKKLLKKLPIGEDIAHALSVDDIQKEDNYQDTKQDNVQTNHQDLNQIALNQVPNDVPVHNVETGEIIDTDDTVEEW